MHIFLFLNVFCIGYGLSETAVISLSPYLKTKPAGSAGELLPNTKAKIVAVDDPSGTPLPPNQSGELYLKGPQVFKGYHNNTEANQNSFSDGWFKTGDIAHYSEDKVLFITDRIKELIKVNAFPVAPAELEELIRSIKGVADACVIGIPNDRFGEVPRAYVVAKDGYKVDTGRIADFVTCQVAPYKKLRGGVVLVDALPKTPSGKMLRREVKQWYLKEGK